MNNINPVSVLMSFLPLRRLNILLGSLVFGVAIETLLSSWRSEQMQESYHSNLSIYTVHKCNIISVQTSYFSCLKPTSHLHSPSPCSWRILVTSTRVPRPHVLRLPTVNANTDNLLASLGSYQLLPSELLLLARLNGCDSKISCNTTAPCSYGLEDPSDALWLRAYQCCSKFVVLFNIGLASLLFFVAAIIADGSVFYPLRSGLSDAPASSLIMLSLASLLYIVIVPPKLQFALYGKDSLNTICYIFSICTLAVLLPAIAVVWLSTILFVVTLVGFVFEYAILLTITTLRLFFVVVRYQVESTSLRLRSIYFAHDTTAQSENDHQLLNAGVNFLLRVRNNFLFERVSHAIEEHALQVIQNHMPDRVARQVLEEFATNITVGDHEGITYRSVTNISDLTQQASISAPELTPPP